MFANVICVTGSHTFLPTNWGAAMASKPVLASPPSRRALAAVGEYHPRNRIRQEKYPSGFKHEHDSHHHWGPCPLEDFSDENRCGLAHSRSGTIGGPATVVRFYYGTLKGVNLIFGCSPNFCTPMHGYEATREAAMAAFAKSRRGS